MGRLPGVGSGARVDPGSGRLTRRHPRPASVAEGIGDAAQLHQLRQAGCQYGQGHHFAGPLGAAQLTTLLDRQPQSAQTMHAR
jgi:predicted signal transduction protein with EAL and GGDEF domain